MEKKRTRPLRPARTKSTFRSGEGAQSTRDGRDDGSSAKANRTFAPKATEARSPAFQPKHRASGGAERRTPGWAKMPTKSEKGSTPWPKQSTRTEGRGGESWAKKPHGPKSSASQPKVKPKGGAERRTPGWAGTPTKMEKEGNEGTGRGEVKVYGLHACMALFTKRPQDIIRVYCDDTHLKTLGPLLKWCASQKKAYHVVSAEEMERVTQSIHHEGVCILALEQAAPTFEELMERLKSENGSVCLVYLDDVQNPHNLGSILRVCAHFGAVYILGDSSKLPRLSPSSYRIAKGGAEQVQVIALHHPKRAIHQLKEAGFALVASSSHQGESLYRYTFPARTLLAFGSEGTGLSPAIMGEADATLQIPGSGQVESLNVAIAAALCIGEYWRQQQ